MSNLYYKNLLLWTFCVLMSFYYKSICTIMRHAKNTKFVFFVTQKTQNSSPMTQKTQKTHLWQMRSFTGCRRKHKKRVCSECVFLPDVPDWYVYLDCWFWSFQFWLQFTSEWIKNWPFFVRNHLPLENKFSAWKFEGKKSTERGWRKTRNLAHVAVTVQ